MYGLGKSKDRQVIRATAVKFCALSQAVNFKAKFNPKKKLEKLGCRLHLLSTT